MTERSGPRLWGFAVPGGAFAITFLIFLPFARIGVDAHHDGVMLKPALDVLSGQRLFTDTFSQYGVLATYFQAAFLAVFGKTLFAIKLGTVLMYASASAFLVAAWRRFLPMTLVLLAYLIWLTLAPFYEPGWVFLPWSSVYALAFQSAALYFLLRTAEAERPALPALACGVCAALVVWCRIPVGVFLTAALGVSYVAPTRTRRPRAWCWSVLLAAIGGGLAVHLGFFAFLLLGGTFEDWVIQTLKWPALWATKHGSGITNVLPGKGGKLVSGLFVLKYFDSLVRSSGDASTAIGPLLLALAVALVAVLALAVGRAMPGRPVVRFGEAFGGRLPLLALFGTLALFLWLATPPDLPPAPEVFPWRLSRVYCWAFLVPVFLLATTGSALLRWPSFVNDDGEDHSVRIAGTLCGIVALASWLQYYPIADPRHLFWGVAPGLGAFVFFVWQVGRGRTRLVAIGLTLLVLPLASERVGAARQKLAISYQKLHGRSVLRGMYVSPPDAAHWSEVLKAVESSKAGRPDVPMLIEGEDAIYGTFVGNLDNCSPFYIEWLGLPRGRDFPERRRRFITERSPLIFVQAKNAARVGPIAQEFGYTVLRQIEGSGDLLLGPSPDAGRTALQPGATSVR